MTISNLVKSSVLIGLSLCVFASKAKSQNFSNNISAPTQFSTSGSVSFNQIIELKCQNKFTGYKRFVTKDNGLKVRTEVKYICGQVVDVTKVTTLLK